LVVCRRRRAEEGGFLTPLLDRVRRVEWVREREVDNRLGEGLKAFGLRVGHVAAQGESPVGEITQVRGGGAPRDRVVQRRVPREDVSLEHTAEQEREWGGAIASLEPGGKARDEVGLSIEARAEDVVVERFGDLEGRDQVEPRRAERSAADLRPRRLT